MERNNGTHVSILHSGVVSLATQAQEHGKKDMTQEKRKHEIQQTLYSFLFFCVFKLMQYCYNALVSGNISLIALVLVPYHED